MRYARTVGLTAILLLAIAGFTVLKEGFRDRDKASLGATSDVFSKLNGEVLNPSPRHPCSSSKTSTENPSASVITEARSSC
jgi:hypothetical protein